MSRCAHAVTEPVTLTTGETVARVCTNCLAQLDPRFGCLSCEWVVDSRINSPVEVHTVVTDCGTHGLTRREVSR